MRAISSLDVMRAGIGEVHFRMVSESLRIFYHHHVHPYSTKVLKWVDFHQVVDAMPIPT